MAKLTLSDITPGKAFKIYYGPNNFNNQTIHIRAIVDKDQYVVARYSNRKGWRYRLEYYLFFEFLIRDGHIKCVSSKVVWS